MNRYHFKQALLGLLLLAVVMWSALMVPPIKLTSGYFDQIKNQDLSAWLHEIPALQIEVMAAHDSTAGRYVENFLTPLMPYWSDLTVDYVDPTRHPEKVRSYGIQSRGDMVIHHQDRHFVLSSLSYETLFNGLQSLLNPRAGWVLVLDDFGSQSLGLETVGLGRWINMLQRLNYHVTSMAWRPNLSLPNDVKAIVLADPQQALPEPAFQWLQQQLQAGVGLWWLSNPESMASQARLSLLFDAWPAQNTDNNSGQVNYQASHQITRDFTYPTIWQGLATFETDGQTVLSTESGAVFAATHESQFGRLLLVGDSDFINNELLQSGGNQSLSLRMLDWVMGYDNRINVPDLSAEKSGLFLTEDHIILMSTILLLLLPGFGLLTAVWLWFSNRRRKT